MSYNPLPQDINNNVNVRISQHDIFDQVVIAQRENQVATSFFGTNNTITDLVDVVTAGGGSASMGSGKATFNSGTSATASCVASTPLTTHYSPGFEVFSMFTATWTAPTSANSTQFVGLWDLVNDGFYVGYNGLNFGIASMTGSVQTFVNRTNWNGDLLNGSSTSRFTRNGVPEAINLTYLNLFRIRFGWLGAAPILFEVCSPDGNWIVFHTIVQPNTSANPSIQNPDLPMTLSITKSSADATNLSMNVACWSAGTASPATISEINYEEVTWTSATALNTSLIAQIAQAGVASFTIATTGTISAGVAIFEVTPDARNWFPLTVVPLDVSLPGVQSVNLAAGTVTFQAFVGGYVEARIRLSTVITGAGSVKAEIRPSATGATLPAQVFQPVGTNLHTVVDSGTISVTTSTTGNTPAAASVGVTSATVLASNASRKGAVFTNTSTRTISFGLNGATAVLNSGITLSPGGIWVMDQFTFTTGAITAIASGAAANLAIQEMQ